MLNCLLIDDEPLALDVLEKYIEDVPYLHLAGRATNAFKAMEVLQKGCIDLMFLDIQMPKLSGTSLVKTLQHPPKIIFTTAHKEYAHEGFELDVVDYLLKPIRYDRFLRAVNKAFEDVRSSVRHKKIQWQVVWKSFLVVPPSPTRVKGQQ